MFYSICYDIRDDRERTPGLINVLKDFGERVWFSVFEANPPPEERERLKTRALKVLDQGEDSLRICRICAARASRVEDPGQETLAQGREVIVI